MSSAPIPNLALVATPSDGAWGWIRSSIYAVLSRNPASNRVVVEAARLAPGDHVLDIGCGAGAALAYADPVVSEGSLSGVDPTPRMVTVATRRVPRATIKLGGAEDLPFESDRFTVAWSVAAFHHWPHPAAGLAEARRVLAPGGRLLVVEHLLSKDEGHGLDAAGVSDLQAAMTAAGFSTTTVDQVKGGRRLFSVVTAT